MVRLSILIATMPSRVNQLARLNGILIPQLISGIEVIADNEMGYNIGAKRNKLLQQATGDYIVFVDDDDLISPNYIQAILTAIESNPDCVGISGEITLNGSAPKQWKISREYSHWYESDNVYYRTPNHISPVKRELALQIGFPEISFGEDAEYSRRLLPLLKTEVIIEEKLYTYIYNDK